MTVDQDKLMDFLHKFVGDLGATMAAGSVLLGDRLGFYRALADQPLLPRELAERTGTATRYVDEWLRGQAAGGYVQYDPQAGTYSLTPEQAFALTDPDGAVYVPGAFQLALGALRAEDQVTEAFRTGAGIGWHQHDDEVFAGCERFFRPGYAANLVSSWLPALDGVEAKLGSGRPRRRRRLRPRRVHRADGRGLPELGVHRFGLPRRVGSASQQAGRRRGPGRPGVLRRGVGPDVHRRPV